MSTNAWLDAQDGESAASAWAAIEHKHHTDLGGTPDTWCITRSGIAQFVATFLAWPIERVLWLTSYQHEARTDEETYPDGMRREDEDEAAAERIKRWPPPTFWSKRAVMRSFFEHGIDLRTACFEEWKVRELVEGPRGLQHHYISCAPASISEQVQTLALRAFDRETGRAVSIDLDRDRVWTIGDVDLKTLDLWLHHQPFELPWPSCNVDAVRGFLAQAVADIDAHFDVSAVWPEVVPNRFASGAFAVEIGERAGGITAMACGLPWGYRVEMWFETTASGVEGWIDYELPRALGEPALARLATIPGIAL